MNFFKSVFSDDPNPPESEIPCNATQNKEQGDPNSQSLPTEHRSDLSPSPNDDDASAAGGWNLGGFMRTLSTKSESILETYRRDLKEFGTGLKKEIEVAQGSLGTVGQTLDEFGSSVVKGTAQIISQGKDAILTANVGLNSDNNETYSSEKGLNSKLYSRFDVQVHAIQADASTYCEEPEDLDDYNKWKLDFSLEEKKEKTESLLKENDAVSSMYKRVVPKSVDHETFWYRYNYKIYKFKKAEDVRARLVKQMSRQEEELSWDVEDDDWEYENKAKPNLLTNNEVGAEDLGKKVEAESQIGSSATGNEVGTKGLNVEDVPNSGKKESEVKKRDDVLLSKELGHDTSKSIDESKVENSTVVQETEGGSKKSDKVVGSVEALNLGGDSVVNKSAPASKPDEKVMTERKADDGKSSNNDSSLVASQQSATKSDEEVVVERKADDGKHTTKDNDSSQVARQQHSAPEEADLGWDEIEDLSSIDEKKSNPSDSQNKFQLRKCQTATDEEDLSWDIEDDDDDGPSKPKA